MSRAQRWPRPLLGDAGASGSPWSSRVRTRVPSRTLQVTSRRTGPLPGAEGDTGPRRERDVPLRPLCEPGLAAPYRTGVDTPQVPGPSRLSCAQSRVPPCPEAFPVRVADLDPLSPGLCPMPGGSQFRFRFRGACWAGLVSTARSPWACEHSHHVGTEGASSRGGAPGLGSITRGAQGRLGVQRAWGTRRLPLQGTSTCCGHTSSPLRRWVVTAFTVGDTPVFSEAPRTTLTLVAVQGADKTASRCWGWTRTRARTSSRGPSLC